MKCVSHISSIMDVVRNNYLVVHEKPSATLIRIYLHNESRYRAKPDPEVLLAELKKENEGEIVRIVSEKLITFNRLYQHACKMLITATNIFDAWYQVLRLRGAELLCAGGSDHFGAVLLLCPILNGHANLYKCAQDSTEHSWAVRRRAEHEVTGYYEVIQCYQKVLKIYSGQNII